MSSDPAEFADTVLGSALTAHVTRLLLDRGSAGCRYTDLANPTSNKSYAAIGYEPVADFARYGFS